MAGNGVRAAWRRPPEWPPAWRAGLAGFGGLVQKRAEAWTVVGAENLCHQVIFVEDAASAVTPLDPEMVQVGDAVSSPARGRLPRWR
jgi:hypothetical protein